LIFKCTTIVEIKHYKIKLFSAFIELLSYYQRISAFIEIFVIFCYRNLPTDLEVVKKLNELSEHFVRSKNNTINYCIKEIH